MRPRMVLVTMLTAGLASLVGCTVPREAGFGDVRKLVDGRGIARVHWKQGTDEDARVDAHVRDLLGRELTAATAVEVALLNNPRLQATFERLGVAQGDVVQAGLLRNPSITGHVGLPIGAGLVEWDVSIVAPFLDAILIPLRKRFAKAEFERVKLEVADEILATAAEARRAFYQMQAANQVLAMERMVLEAGQASAELAMRQHAAGNMSDLDLSAQQEQYAQTKLDTARAEVRLLTDREHLSRILGVWGAQTEWKVAPTLPDLPAEEPPLEHVESFAIAHRLDLLAARRDIETRSAALRITRTTRVIGGLDVGAAGHRDADGPLTVGPNLTVELPIFNQKQGEVARLVAEMRAAMRRSEALAVAIRSEVRDARNRLLAERATVDYYRKTLIPLRERRVALTLQQYNAMLLGVYQLLQSKQAEITAYREYIEAVRDYWMARSDLERAAGGPLAENEPAGSARQGAK